jgi:membrane protein involved in colicin uptake
MIVPVILGLLGLSGILVFACHLQSKRAAEAEREAASLRDALARAKYMARRLQEAIEKQTKAEVTANAERAELAQTSDSDLVNRANDLFGGGLPDKPRARSGRGAGPAGAAGSGGAGDGTGEV